MEHTVRIDRPPADVFGYLTAVETGRGIAAGMG